MAKVKYDGGPDALDVVVGEESLHVERGEAVEVSDEVAEQLVQQGWELVGAKKSNSSRGQSASEKE